MNNAQASVADKHGTVAALYEDGKVAGSYLEKRMRFSWQRVAHERQVAILNDIVRAHRPGKVLEVAPGPARLSVEIAGITRGTMVENSAEMITIARERLRQAGLEKNWQVLQGDAFNLKPTLRDERFDFVYSFRLIRHFHDAERAQIYAQVREHLVDGGRFAFDVVNSVMRARIDGEGEKPADELAVYDAVHTPASFEKEVRQAGFEVVSMTPVIRHFGLQAGLSHKLDDRIPGVCASMVRTIEKFPSGEPLEWVALLQKR